MKQLQIDQQQKSVDLHLQSIPPPIQQVKRYQRSQMPLSSRDLKRQKDNKEGEMSYFKKHQTKKQSLADISQSHNKRLRMVSSKSSSSSSSLRSSQAPPNESAVKVIKLPPQKLEQPYILKSKLQEKEPDVEETGRTTELENYFQQQNQIHAVITRKTNDQFFPKVQLDLKPKVIKRKDFQKFQVNESEIKNQRSEEVQTFEPVASKQFQLQNIGKVLRKKATLQDFKQKMIQQQVQPPFSPAPQLPLNVKNLEMRKSQSSFPLSQIQDQLSNKVFERRPKQVKRVMIGQSQKRIVKGLVSKQFQLLQNSKSQRDLPDFSLISPSNHGSVVFKAPVLHSVHLSTPNAPKDSFLQSQSQFKIQPVVVKSSRNQEPMQQEFFSISGQKEIHQRQTYSSFFARQSQQSTKRKQPQVKKLPSIFQTANKFFKKEQKKTGEEKGVQAEMVLKE